MTPIPDTNNPQLLIDTFYARCNEITQIVSRVHSAKASIVTHWDAEKRGLHVRACSGVEGNDYSVGQFIPYDEQLHCFRVLEFSKPVCIVNTLLKEGNDVREISYMGTPLHTQEGPFGTLCVIEGNPVQNIKQTEQTMAKFKEILEGDLALLLNKDISIAHSALWANQG